MKLFNKISPPRAVALSYVAIVLFGALVFLCPFSLNNCRLSFIDALFTSMSAISTTGLSPIDPSANLSFFGKAFLCIMIEIGGLGITIIGAFFFIYMGRKINISTRNVLKESINFSEGNGIVKFVKSILTFTLLIEGVFFLLFFPFFLKHFSFVQSIFYSIFHTVSAFANCGFDVFPSSDSITFMKDSKIFVFLTYLLMFIGGLGFVVIFEIKNKKFQFKRYSLHAIVVIIVSLILDIGGTIFYKITNSQIALLDAFFMNITSRHGGFYTYNPIYLSNASKVLSYIFIIIGTSPGSTGGGIKTTSLFVLFNSLRGDFNQKKIQSFKYTIPPDAFMKAFTLLFIVIILLSTCCAIALLVQPEIDLFTMLYELTSCFGTVGLSMGATSFLNSFNKFLCVLLMFCGRVGPLTLAHVIVTDNKDKLFYPDGVIAIG